VGKRSERRESKSEREARSQELRNSIIPPSRRDERKEEARARRIAGETEKRLPNVETKFALHPTSDSARQVTNPFAAKIGSPPGERRGRSISGEGGRRLTKTDTKTFIGMGRKGPEANVHVTRRKTTPGRIGVQSGGQFGRKWSTPVLPGRAGRVDDRTAFYGHPDDDAEDEKDYREQSHIKRHREIQKLSRATRDPKTGTTIPATTVARETAAQLRKEHERERRVSDPRKSDSNFLSPPSEMGRAALEKKLAARSKPTNESVWPPRRPPLVEIY